MCRNCARKWRFCRHPPEPPFPKADQRRLFPPDPGPRRGRRVPPDRGWRASGQTVKNVGHRAVPWRPFRARGLSGQPCLAQRRTAPRATACDDLGKIFRAQPSLCHAFGKVDAHDTGNRTAKPEMFIHLSETGRLAVHLSGLRLAPSALSKHQPAFCALPFGCGRSRRPSTPPAIIVASDSTTIDAGQDRPLRAGSAAQPPAPSRRAVSTTTCLRSSFGGWVPKKRFPGSGRRSK